MEFVEQAVFTSAETDTRLGYQLVGAGQGIEERDLRALATWGPSHDGLAPHAERASVNFHALPSGKYAVSRSLIHGREYSGRGGGRLYTQYLIVDPPVLRKFANNPFALINAAIASEALRLYDRVPRVLEPIRILGRAADLDVPCVERAMHRFGPQWFPIAVELLLATDVPVAVAGGEYLDKWVAALLHLLPPPWRTLISFSTGLRFSVHRPFRLITTARGSTDAGVLQRRYGFQVLDVTAEPPAGLTLSHPWARFLDRFLRRPRLITLKTLYRRLRSVHESDPAAFEAWAHDVLQETFGAHASGAAVRKLRDREPATPAGSVETRAVERTSLFAKDDGDPPRESEDEAGTCRLCLAEGTAPEADDAWETVGPGGAAMPDNACIGGTLPRTNMRASGESNTTGNLALAAQPRVEERPRPKPRPDEPWVIERLEFLDDLVFEAIKGDDEAMQRLFSVWPQIRDELGMELLAEACAQYLRFAGSVWERGLAEEDEAGLDAAFRALNVTELLFDGRW
ncbi:MAG: hypothetical protein D6741_15450 [Planctomycetota bacterium]|nr:MAG: hypothetical protein D6741_15450 [Planctomycetota bacterium]